MVQRVGFGVAPSGRERLLIRRFVRCSASFETAWAGDSEAVTRGAAGVCGLAAGAEILFPQLKMFGRVVRPVYLHCHKPPLNVYFYFAAYNVTSLAGGT